MKRIYFLVRDIVATGELVDALLLARVPERNINVLAKRGTELGDLPEASFLEKTDVIPAFGQGLVVGGLTGTLAGLIAVAFASDFTLGSGLFVGTFLFGTGLGALSSSMIGSSTGSRRLKSFSQAIENGQLLVMVDVAKSRVTQIEGLVKARHPEVECKGIEPLIPSFP